MMSKDFNALLHETFLAAMARTHCETCGEPLPVPDYRPRTPSQERIRKAFETGGIDAGIEAGLATLGHRP